MTKQQTHRLLKPLFTKPSKQGKEKLVAFVKERIYGSVTLLAINVSLLVHEGLTVKYAFSAILATALGLWLASIFAAVTAYRIVHDKNMPREEIVHEFTIHRGLLFAALPSVIMLSLAAFEIIALKTAIIADISLAIVAMIITIMRSAKTSSNSLQTALISVLIQAGVAGLIIVIKLGAE